MVVSQERRAVASARDHLHHAFRHHGRRHPARGEGPHRHGGRTDDGRLPRGGRHRRAGAARRALPRRRPCVRRAHRRQDQPARAGVRRERCQHPFRDAGQSPRPGVGPGGSSSGSAVAVGSGEADVAFGSDTGGSVRIPSACCGTVGLKTTHGRVSLEGVWPLALSLDTIGPMAADVERVIAGMQLLEPGFEPAATPPAIVGRFRPDGVDPAVDDAIDRLLAASELEVVEIDLPGWAAAQAAGGVVLIAEAWQADRHLLDRRDRLGADVADRLELGRHITSDAFDARRQGLRGVESRARGGALARGARRTAHAEPLPAAHRRDGRRHPPVDHHAADQRGRAARARDPRRRRARCPRASSSSGPTTERSASSPRAACWRRPQALWRSCRR